MAVLTVSLLVLTCYSARLAEEEERKKMSNSGFRLFQVGHLGMVIGLS